MNAEPIQWSEEKLVRLQEKLVGSWAEDTWELKGWKCVRYLRFSLSSPSLKAELKYAVWYKFHSGQWNVKNDQSHFCTDFNVLVRWFNHVAPATPSLLEKNLEYWIWSLRSYLAENNELVHRHFKGIRKGRGHVEYELEDLRLLLLRQLYKIIADAYDDREETDKDVWDMRKMGVSVNLTLSGGFHLDFTSITQPWLRQLAKEFMKYNVAVNSAGDCYAKLGALNTFSQFLAHQAPLCRITDMNRALMLKYISFLREQQRTIPRRNRLLISLRTVFETCVYRLQVPGLTKERLLFEDDIAKAPKTEGEREIPEEVLEQLRSHLDTLPTIILRMVTILLECGLRINEVCTLPPACLICDDRHEWYLRFYQRKTHKEHVIPLINENVVGTIQAQQQEIREQWGEQCPYLFPSPLSHQLPYKQDTFRNNLNEWALKHQIQDRWGKPYHFTPHQFRHTLSMRLLNEDVPLEVISRLLGHSSLFMTQVYARAKEKKLRAELERVARKHKTVDYQGRTVKGDPSATTPEAQMVRKGMRGQTLPVGGCGRLVVLGDCSHANKCLTCPMWLTSTDDLFALKSFYDRAVRLKQRALEAGNRFVIEQQERIISNLFVRIKSLEDTSGDGMLSVDDMLTQLRTDLIEAESALEEAHEAGLVLAAKHIERAITELKARIAALEESA
jgi:integrase